MASSLFAQLPLWVASFDSNSWGLTYTTHPIILLSHNRLNLIVLLSHSRTYYIGRCSMRPHLCTHRSSLTVTPLTSTHTQMRELLDTNLWNGELKSHAILMSLKIPISLVSWKIYLFIRKKRKSTKYNNMIGKAVNGYSKIRYPSVSV